MGTAACIGMDCCDGLKVLEDTVVPSKSRCNLTPVETRLFVKRRPRRRKRRMTNRYTNRDALDRPSERSLAPKHACQIMYANNQIYHSESMRQPCPSRLTDIFGSLPDVPKDLIGNSPLRDILR